MVTMMMMMIAGTMMWITTMMMMPRMIAGQDSVGSGRGEGRLLADYREAL